MKEFKVRFTKEELLEIETYLGKENILASDLKDFLLKTICGFNVPEKIDEYIKNAKPGDIISMKKIREDLNLDIGLSIRSSEGIKLARRVDLEFFKKNGNVSLYKKL